MDPESLVESGEWADLPVARADPEPVAEPSESEDQEASAAPGEPDDLEAAEVPLTPDDPEPEAPEAEDPLAPEDPEPEAPEAEDPLAPEDPEPEDPEEVAPEAEDPAGPLGAFLRRSGNRTRLTSPVLSTLIAKGPRIATACPAPLVRSLYSRSIRAISILFSARVGHSEPMLSVTWLSRRMGRANIDSE